jgi:hypothetical protein
MYMHTQKLTLKLPNTPKERSPVFGKVEGNTLHTKSIRNTFRILSTPVPSSI